MSNAIVERDEVNKLRRFLDSPPVLAQLQKAAPANLSPQRLIRQTISLVQKNPSLLRCTQLSVLQGVMQSAELGLELTGPLGHAFLVPRYDKRVRANVATFQIGWKGLVALAFRSDLVAAFPVRYVYANEPFEVEYGTQHQIRHRPLWTNKGELVAVYAAVYYKSGGRDFEVMSVEDVQAHREKYVPRSDRETAWDTSFPEMAAKTVCRKLCRRLSLCPEAQAAAAIDEEEESGGYGQADQTRTDEVLAMLGGGEEPTEGSSDEQQGGDRPAQPE